MTVVAGDEASPNEQVAPESTPGPGAYDHEVVPAGASGSDTEPPSPIAEPSTPLAFGPATTDGAAFTTVTEAESEPASSSLTVAAIVWAPPVVYVWLPEHVPLPFASVTAPAVAGLPSPQSIEQVC